MEEQAMIADDFGTLARIAERAQYQNRAYRAPVTAAKTHRITVNAKTGERTVESGDAVVAPVKPVAVATATARPADRPSPICWEVRRRPIGNTYPRPKPDHRGRVPDVLAVTAEVFGVTVPAMLSPLRIQRLAYPRFAAMHFMHTVLRLSLPSIGKVFKRDHTTILSGVRRAAHLRCDDISFAGHSRLLARELRRKWSVQ